jgi:hypothetical protein
MKIEDQNAKIEKDTIDPASAERHRQLSACGGPAGG